jgi:hypothetical protein
MNNTQVAIIILLIILCVIALVAPRTRTRSLLVPVCLLLGWYWDAGGFWPTIRALTHAVRGFAGSLHIH